MAYKMSLYLRDTTEHHLATVLARTHRAKPGPLIAALLELAASAPGSDPVAYLRDLVDEARADWQHGLDILRSAGWEYAEIRAACHALGGPEMVSVFGWPSPMRMAAELEDAGRLNAVHRAHGVSDEAWRERVRQLAGSDQLARALHAVNRELWRGNADLDARLDGAPQGA